MASDLCKKGEFVEHTCLQCIAIRIALLWLVPIINTHPGTPQMEVAWASGPLRGLPAPGFEHKGALSVGAGVLLVKRGFPMEPQLGSSVFEQLQSTVNCPEPHRQIFGQQSKEIKKHNACL